MRGDHFNFVAAGFCFIFQFTPLREGRQRDFVLFAELEKFQFTPLREGRLLHFLYTVHDHSFQFTPLREGRRCRKRRLWWGRYFNSRPCVRGDHDFPPSQKGPVNFNSRPCVRGDRLVGRLWRHRRYFNSRPCVRGDAYSSESYSKSKISIHAPA